MLTAKEATELVLETSKKNRTEEERIFKETRLPEIMSKISNLIDENAKMGKTSIVFTEKDKNLYLVMEELDKLGYYSNIHGSDNNGTRLYISWEKCEPNKKLWYNALIDRVNNALFEDLGF